MCPCFGMNMDELIHEGSTSLLGLLVGFYTLIFRREETTNTKKQ